MTKKNIVLTLTVVAIMSIGAVANADIVPVTGITGHDGGNWPSTNGHLTDMVNALTPNLIISATPGMDTSADPADPSQWTWSGSYQQTWHANSVLAGVGDPGNSIPAAINNKMGWVIMDFGSIVADLENAYLWASSKGQTGSGAEQVQNYNLYYSSGAGITSLPSMPNAKDTRGDYDFSIGDWTQIGSTNILGQADGAVSNTIALGGVSAQYIGIEVLSIYGVDNRMAIAQVEITAAPEPATMSLLALGGLAMLRRRRRA